MTGTGKNHDCFAFIPALLMLLVFCMGTLAGCSLPSNNTNTSVTVDENGALTEVIVEDQGDDTYTPEELQAFIEENLATYNQGQEQPPVTLENCKIENGSVRLTLHYASCTDYMNFNQVTCFLGTIKEAEDAGYSLERTWLEPNGREGDEAIIREREKEWKIFIISEPINVRLPDKILYASDNVKVTGRLAATVETVMSNTETTEEAPQATVHPLATVAERFAYIIYK